LETIVAALKRIGTAEALAAVAAWREAAPTIKIIG